MTKAEIVSEISRTTGLEKGAVLDIVEKFMEVVKDTMSGAKTYISVDLAVLLSKPEKRRQPAISPRTRQSRYRSTRSRVVQALKGIS